MKLFTARLLMTDCGRVSKKTRGAPTGFFTEVSSVLPRWF